MLSLQLIFYCKTLINGNYLIFFLYIQVTAEGPGLAKTGVTVSKWAEFTVDTRKAGKASLVIICEDDQHKPVNVEVVDKKNGTYTCKYMPKKMAKHTVTITYGGVQIPNSPYRVSNQTKQKKITILSEQYQNLIAKL